MEPSSYQDWKDSPPAYQQSSGYQRFDRQERHQMYGYGATANYDPGTASVSHPVLHPVAPQQTSFIDNNVVVVSQPSPSQNTVVERRRPNDYMCCVVFLMVICCLTGNIFAFVCLIPALILSATACSTVDYDKAKTYGLASCMCSIVSVVVYLTTIVVAGIFIFVFLIAFGPPKIYHNHEQYQ